MSGNSLINYYKTIFALVQHHGYSILEIENLIVFERDIYIGLLEDYLKKKEEENK